MTLSWNIVRTFTNTLCPRAGIQITIFGKRNEILSSHARSVCNSPFYMSSREVSKVTSVTPTSNNNKDENEIDPLSRNFRLLKIAVIGVPNSGKSTLINQILERRVCSTSSKVHTTKRKSRAIFISGDTQLIFLDTPGLVTLKESKRHELEPSFLADAKTSLTEANLIAVVHDLSNKWTRDSLDRKVLQLLQLAPDKPSVLILNKIDVLKSKRILLDLVQKLTYGSLKSSLKSNQQEKMLNPDKEKDQEKLEQVELGWPDFSEIFMVSALEGSGVGDIKEYMLMQAKPGDWVFPSDVITDQRPREIAELAVREKLLDILPKEIPYKIKTTLELWEKSESGILTIVVLAECPAKRYVKMLLGNNGSRIRLVAQEAEQALSNSFRCAVKLKIVVTESKKH